MTATIPFHQGTLTFPESFASKFGLSGDGEVTVEETPQGILLKPTRIYTDEEVAAFEAADRSLEPHRAWLETELANDKDSPALSPEWMEEIERRSAEIDAGEVELIPAEEVFAELRSSQGKPK